MQRFKNSILLKIIYVYGKIVGLCPFSLSNEKFFKFSYLGAFYNFLLASFYTICYSLIIGYRLELRLPRETIIGIAMDALALTFQYLSIVTFWITLTFRQGFLRSILETFVKTDDLASSLHINLLKNNPRRLRNFTLRLATLNCFYISVFVVEHYTLTLYTKFREQACTWVLFNVPKIMIYNVCLLYIELILILLQNYRALNKELLRSFMPGIKYYSFYGFSDATSIMMTKLQAAAQFHESLGQLFESITNFFSLSVFFAIFATFIHSFLDIYFVYRFFTYDRSWKISDFATYVINLLWLQSKIWGLYLMCSVPDATCAEVNKFLSVLYLRMSCNSKFELVYNIIGCCNNN